ncbi:hypothetical protein ACIA2T_01925 [Amycolatopsis japonica]|uniref:hypothetical protein n=1 Tax=Amycolatopsis japonica TaxID=208439 RepID=UPI0037A3DFB7
MKRVAMIFTTSTQAISPSKSSPSPTTSTPTSEYPKFVPKAKVDKRYTQYVDGDKTLFRNPSWRTHLLVIAGLKAPFAASDATKGAFDPGRVRVAFS